MGTERKKENRVPVVKCMIRICVVWATGATSHKTAHSLVFRTSNTHFDNARTVLGCLVAPNIIRIICNYIIHIIDSDPPNKIMFERESERSAWLGARARAGGRAHVASVER